MKSSEITPEFQQLGFKNFNLDGRPEIVKKARHTAAMYFKAFEDIKAGRQNSIALLGQPGAGKSHLLIAVANNLINEQQVGVLYFPFREGFDDLKDDWDAIEAKMDHMKSAEVLLLDDLFKGGPTSFEIKSMFSVLNYRYLNNKPIMVSSECFVDDLIEIDEALASRIYEMCRDYLVELSGDIRELNYRFAK